MASSSGNADGGMPRARDDARLELGTEPGQASESSSARLLSGGDAAASKEPSLVDAVVDKAGNAGAVAPVLCYCASSIMMTVINKYCVSGQRFTMNLFVLLCQCAVCVSIVWLAKRLRLIQLRDLTWREVKMWFPISTMLVFVIWTGSKAIQHMSIPVYTIFKNLTIILIAYGEVFWFGGRVTRIVFLSFVLMVVSSVIAAWPDISKHLGRVAPGVYARAENGLSVYGAHAGTPSAAAAAPAPAPQPASGTSNSGYFWMLCNCLVSAAYVLVMRNRIKGTGFKDWDTMFYNNLLCIPVLAVMSLVRPPHAATH